MKQDPADQSETPADAIAEPAIASAYMVDKEFTTSNPVTMVFRQGRIITDLVTIRRLLAGGAPISEIKDINSLLTCPNCHHVFAPN